MTVTATADFVNEWLLSKGIWGQAHDAKLMVTDGMKICWKGLHSTWLSLSHQDYTMSCIGIITKTAMLSEMQLCNQAVNTKRKHYFSVGNKRASNTTALIKANKRAWCKRPYLELLGSKGKRERQRVRQRERQEEGQRNIFKMYWW